MIDEPERLRLRVAASSRWENEGGAVVDGRSLASDPDYACVDDPTTSDTEAVQLRIRLIAIEYLVISLLAGASEPQRALAREMADYISPRPGYTPHPLTLRAADEMRSLVNRAGQFRLPEERGPRS